MLRIVCSANPIGNDAYALKPYIKVFAKPGASECYTAGGTEVAPMPIDTPALGNGMMSQKGSEMKCSSF